MMSMNLVVAWKGWRGPPAPPPPLWVVASGSRGYTRGSLLREGCQSAALFSSSNGDKKRSSTPLYRTGNNSARVWIWNWGSASAEKLCCLSLFFSCCQEGTSKSSQERGESEVGFPSLSQRVVSGFGLLAWCVTVCCLVTLSWHIDSRRRWIARKWNSAYPSSSFP